MLVHVAFTPGEQTPAPVGIVVDVLRATSTMTQALAAGYRRVLCCAEIEEARALAATEGAGEARRRAPARARSPASTSATRRARSPASRAAPTLILSTTNGTRLLVSAAARFEHVYVGSLLNLDAVARRRARTGRTSRSSARACSASSRSTTRTARAASPRRSAATATDSATAAIRLAGSFDDARDGLGAEPQRLEPPRHGLEADIDWCARENALDVVPRYARTLGAAAEVSV